MEVPETIVCVDCGQQARRLTPPPEEGWETGDSVAYRCTGCNDRWDLVVSDLEAVTESFSYASELRALRRDAEPPLPTPTPTPTQTDP